MNQQNTIPGVLRSVASAVGSPGRTEVSARLTSRSTAAEGQTSTPRAATRLSGHWLWLARVAWLSVATVSIISFFPSLSLNFAALEQVCTGSACDFLSLRPEHLPVLAAWGLSPTAFAAYGTVLGSVQNLAWYAMGVLLFARGSAEPRALFFSFVLMLYGGGPSYQTLAVAPPGWWLPVTAYLFLDSSCFTLFLVLFPTGQFVPRWTRPLALAWIALYVPSSFFPNSPLSLGTWPAAVQALVVLGLYGSVIVAQVYRYRWRSTPVERQQTKWVVLALGVLLLLNVVVWGPVGTQVFGGEAPPLWLVLVVGHVSALATILVPLSIAAAILRYRLWEVDRLINRTLVYGLLTASVVGLYVLLVGALGVLFRSSDSPLIAILATGLVALLFHPLRQRLQRGVNRLLYGQRDEPYQVLARLGQRLEGTFAPEAVLPTLVETVKDALKLSYVAVALQQEETMTLAAAVGEPVEAPLTLPLSYQGELVGHLLLGSHWRDEPFRPADRRLLADLAHQAGVAVYAARLTTDLQQSRERLVGAREEERRRLRRDLHDGLGPTLSSQLLTLDAISRLLDRDPATARALLNELRAQSQAAFLDIRRLIYDLRPPALDDLGLVAALQESLARYRQSGLECVVEVAEPLPALPAAVEVAVYRIAREALTNVARHAGAHTCQVCLTLTTSRPQRGLRLEVLDDGCGLPASFQAGVGLRSMRERAEELGGSLVIEGRSGGGTSVSTWLPVPEEDPCM